MNNIFDNIQMDKDSPISQEAFNANKISSSDQSPHQEYNDYIYKKQRPEPKDYMNIDENLVDDFDNDDEPTPYDHKHAIDGLQKEIRS